MSENLNKKIAVYFDCENVSANHIGYVLDKLKKKGNRIVCQAFKDWNKPNGWNQEVAEKHGIEPIQVFSNGKLKNGADVAIAISVMKELNKGIVQSVALVSSDSDFTHLVTEIRANGVEAIVVGDSNKITDRLRYACDSFIAFPRSNIALKEPSAKAPPKNIENPKDTLVEAVKKVMSNDNDNGFCKVAQIGNYLKEEKGLGLADFEATRRWKNLFDKYPDTFECRRTGKGNSTLEVKLI